ncbi:N-acetylaspartate synthetase isoform X3 [Pelodiscus sinensis]|uniref:N-acetylaspartate synthetase isoform X3 n=1 Tax=Pelodiscus sinensis TaxID=13735 RepID=UPI0003C4652E|nr:N-acetylaspartate synthetase isoform X2 [Pelodiscus sinensis]|eukprot:XP_006134787.1 N-acetylaspartate synthetase isoform X2 [Pelodiscus sinensis]
MHCSSPKMVCETKIVAEDHESISGSKKDTIIVSSSQMWPSLSGSPAPTPASRSGVEEDFKKDNVYIREFHPSDQEVVRRIFYEGIMERIPNTAFRGLKHQPLTQLIYGILIGSCFWVAVLDGNVVGIVAARGNEEDNTMELRRMSVDINFRGKGIAKALGRKVLEFAMLNNYSSIVLGTTAVKMAAHKLYESLGFKHVGVIEHYTLPGMTHSILERMFFQLRYHRYRLQLREE